MKRLMTELMMISVLSILDGGNVRCSLVDRYILINLIHGSKHGDKGQECTPNEKSDLDGVVVPLLDRIIDRFYPTDFIL